MKYIQKLKNWYQSIYSMKWYQQMIYWILILEIFIITVVLLSGLVGRIILGVIILGIIIIRFKLWFNNRRLGKITQDDIFIFGAKGNGKGLLMQLSIIKKYRGWLKRKRPKPLSNIDYGYDTIVESPKKVFSLYPNTYKNLIEDDIKTIIKNDNYEGRDYYLDDASVYFPSHEDNKLNKEYPSLPLFYALSRHLYNMSIIVNTQINSRLWLKFREQVQDGYIEALKNIGWGRFFSSIPILRNYVFVKMRYYQKLESAEQGLLPFKKVAFLNEALGDIYITAGGATKEVYQATNGEIFEQWCLIKKSHLKYDTRIFHEKLFGYKWLG